MTCKELSNACNLHIYLRSTVHRGYSVSYTIHFIVGRSILTMKYFQHFKNGIAARDRRNRFISSFSFLGADAVENINTGDANS